MGKEKNNSIKAAEIKNGVFKLLCLFILPLSLASCSGDS